MSWITVSQPTTLKRKSDQLVVQLKAGEGYESNTYDVTGGGVVPTSAPVTPTTPTPTPTTAPTPAPAPITTTGATNLYEYYTQQGKSLPSITERANLYQKTGLGSASSYIGTAAQNTQILNYLKGTTPATTTPIAKPTNPQEGTTYDDTQAGLRYRFTNGQWQAVQSIPKVAVSGGGTTGAVAGGTTSDADVQTYMTQWGITGTPADYAKSIGITNYTGTALQKANIINDIAQKGSGGLLKTTPITSTSEGAEKPTTPPDVNKDILDEINYLTNAQTLATLKASLGIDETTKPAVPNLSAELLQLRNQYGVDAVETRINDLNKLIGDTEASLRQGLYTEEGRLAPMTLIGTRQRELARQGQEQLDTYNREKATLVDEYNTKQTLINNLMTLESKDYENAKSAYDTNFTQNLQLQQVLTTSANTAQDNARANLTLLLNTMKDSKLTFDAADASTQVSINKLAMQSGMSLDVVKLFLNAKPDDTILAHGTSTDANGQDFVYFISKDPITGTPTTTKVYTGGVKTTGGIQLSASQKTKLIGIGLTQADINTLQQGMASSGLDVFLAGQEGLPDSQKTKIRNIVMGVTSKITIEEWLLDLKNKGKTREEAEIEFMSAGNAITDTEKVIFDKIFGVATPPATTTKKWWEIWK